MYKEIIYFIHNEMEMNKIFKENAYTRGFSEALEKVLEYVQKLKMRYSDEH